MDQGGSGQEDKKVLKEIFRELHAMPLVNRVSPIQGNGIR